MGTVRNSEFRDEAQGAAQRMTRHIESDRRGMSEHATPRFARRTNLLRFPDA